MEETITNRVVTADALRYIRLPKEHWDARLDLIPVSVRPRLTRYMTGMDQVFELGGGLVLTGDAGVGKSSIAAVACKAAFAAGHHAFFTTLWELRDASREDTMFSEFTSMMHRAKTVDLLVMDGLRPEDADEKWWLSARAIEELLAFRRGNRKPTIVTTRMKNHELTQRFKGIADAIEGACILLNVTGQNMREERANAITAKLLGS